MKKSLLVHYSLLAIPLSIIGFPLYIYLPTFYTLDVGLDVALVGVLIFIARISDVITDPYLGYLSDKSQKLFTSRKPIMFLGSLILIFSFYHLINPNYEYPKMWLIMFSILIYFGWSMINIPYLTFSSEISDDYYHKTQLNSSRELFTIIGLIFALLIPYIFSVSENTQETLDLLYLSFIILYIPFFLILIKKVKIKNQNFNSKFTFEDIRKVYKEMPNLKYLQIGYFINNLANAIPATIFLLFMQLVLQEKDSSGLVLILYFLSGIIALPVWTLISKRTNKKTVWISSIILASCSFIFVPFLTAGDLNLFIIISIISGLSLGADLAFPASIQADIAQKVKMIQNNVSGLLFGIWTMLTKLSLALALVISFGILGLVGFNQENPSTQALITISLLYGLAPVILKLITIFFINKYKESNS